jgi:hypothetical protein
MENKMSEQLERQLIEIVALDRIDKPISSMSGKIKRRKPKLAKGIDLADFDNHYDGDRVWARSQYDDRLKARGLKDGVEKFEARFPKYGRILKGYIEEQRTIRETHLYFGVQDGCRVTSRDYLGVMEDLGFSPGMSERLYPELMDISRKLARKRDESERSILIG